ncbi:hypothetical protein BJ138DRAFT_1153062 [Hygrophoropsis aurantiaca]|uniref:Uncharacterized protein n=1 Tax=Hygrophoropsis aurantiaca TaxID=72124 RepID=A0ACB8AAQ1_9AGAM|nr:hypothetical protein BJ138DRAFT_1153062 [Hygrophoropsis aurantiaca]
MHEAISLRMRRVERNITSMKDDFLRRVDSVEDNIAAQILDLRAILATVHVSGNLNTVTSPVHAPSRLVMQPPSPSISANHPPPIVAVSQRVTSNPLDSSRQLGQCLPREAIPLENLGIAHLGDEQHPFDKTKIPEPPTLHFSQDIPGLFREWENSSLLVVNGRGIPIKYWGEFYKKCKGAKKTAWDALRSEWGNWKFIAEERQRFTSEEAFWSQYSDCDGKPLLYKHILNRLQHHRTTSTAQDASDARTFFAGNLDSPNAQGKFRYKKAGKSYLYTKDDVIAKKWQELLNTRPDIAAQWASMRPLLPTPTPSSAA